MEKERAKIALAMIVRNEAENLGRCIAAAAPLVERLVITDTGSTDGTQKLLGELAEEHGLALDLAEEPWENFKVNRSSLMRRARGAADWLLLLDADLVIHAPDPLPDLEEADCWEGRVDFSGMDYTLPFLVRASKPWYYEGVAHSYLACEEKFEEREMPGLWVEDYSRTTNEKIERDLVALLADHAANPRNARTVFYLAQSYYDLGRIHEAIAFYRMRAEMGSGWDEEAYFARYRLGSLLCEHVDFRQGARELLAAWEARPHRIEALRALAGSATAVANKITDSRGDRLFVGSRSYQPHEIRLAPVEPPLRGTPAEFASLAGCRPSQLRRLTKSFDASKVSAIIVTRGNVDLEPTLAPIREAFEDIVIWNNAERLRDLGPFGRYAAIQEAKNPVVAWVDDDVIFEDWEALLAHYDPERVVVNMDQPWIEGAGYGDFLAMMGAGSICPAWLPAKVFERYRLVYPHDPWFLLESDFVFGVLAPFTRVDLPYAVREFSDDANRLYTQPWQTEQKWAAINRCREILELPE